MMDRVDFVILDECVARSLNLLRSTFHESSEGGGGWYHSLDVPRPGPSATAVAIASFLTFDKQNSHVDDGLSFLKTRQLAATDPRLDGGWAVNTSFGLPLTEATALVARLMARTRTLLLPNSPDIFRAYAWLMRNQNTDGGWGSFLGHPSRVWLTGMAVRAIAELNPYEMGLRRGVQWLIDNRDPTTLAWGERPHTPPTTTHTAFVLTALVDTGLGPQDHAIEDAIGHGYTWLQRNLDPESVHDDAARVESYNLNSTLPDGTSITFHSTVWHPGLPFAVSALVRHPSGPDSQLITQSIETIIKTQQPDGRWPNPDSAAGMSVWSVWPFLEAVADITKYGMTRPGDLVTWYESGTVVVQHADARGVSLMRLERRARQLRLSATISRHWASAILILAVIFAGTSALLGELGWQELAFGLGVPIFLLLVQESVHRARYHGNDNT